VESSDNNDEEEDQFDHETSSSDEEDVEHFENRKTKESQNKRKRIVYADSDSSDEHSNKKKSSSKGKEKNVVTKLNFKALLKARREQLPSVNDEKTDIPLQLLMILEKLQKHEYSGPFWEPVNEKYYYDYREKVQDPMDLGTITKRITTGFYANQHEFAVDVRKVWQNCQLYNLEGSDIHADSKLLSAYFEEMFVQLCEMLSLSKFNKCAEDLQKIPPTTAINNTEDTSIIGDLVIDNNQTLNEVIEEKN
jgi:hypothetical protein